MELNCACLYQFIIIPILPTILFSQLAGTSLWFAGNAVILDLQRDWGLAPSYDLESAFADYLIPTIAQRYADE